jgi:hypothetical protein
MAVKQKSSCIAATTALIAMASTLSLGVGPSDYAEEMARFKVEAPIKGVVSWQGAGVPVGRILLIRDEKGLCAVRFTSSRKEDELSEPSIFSTGGETYYAEYDWYSAAEGHADFQSAGMTQGHDKLSGGPGIVIPFLPHSFGFYKSHVRCGPFKLAWYSPTLVSFSKAYATGQMFRDDVAIGLTAWQNIQDVDLGDPKLKWYRLEGDRKNLYIPLEDLPGFRPESRPEGENK